MDYSIWTSYWTNEGVVHNSPLSLSLSSQILKTKTATFSQTKFIRGEISNSSVTCLSDSETMKPQLVHKLISTEPQFYWCMSIPLRRSLSQRHHVICHVIPTCRTEMPPNTHRHASIKYPPYLITDPINQVFHRPTPSSKDSRFNTANRISVLEGEIT